jgi:hypothetical protein
MPSPPLDSHDINFADDLLKGADQISEFLYGDMNHRRKVYHLAETSRIPIFRLGSVLCARRSVILAWVAQQERRVWPTSEAISLPALPSQSQSSVFGKNGSKT